MRRITLWLLSTVAALVLLFTYRTSTGTPATATTGTAQAPATTTTPAPSGTASPAPSATSGGSAGTGSSNSSASPASGSRTYTGSVAATRWGDVQVTIAVTDGKITDVAVPVYPNGNGRDQEISAYALPTLRQETLTAQNADIDTVSGATVTSDGYLQSLQSALDAAHLS